MIHLTISGYRHADAWLQTGRYDAMLSISDEGGTKRGSLRTGTDLLLDFNDSWPGRGRGEGKLACDEDIWKLLNFGKNLPEDAMVLCHCGRGRSRSTAAAILLLIGSGHLEAPAACRHVMAIAPKGSPNGWMIHLAERHLQCRLREHCFGRVKGPENYS